MTAKWTGNHSESGILRKSEFKEKKEELFVFGYTCKLFRDDERALHIDQGKHLIPWMGDETLKIDRYDARGALHELASLEAPAGGFDWRVELTKGEQDVEQLCDEERYRALHTDEDEEEMYREEELKRLHAAGYGQVGFNYDNGVPAAPAAAAVETDEPFEPTPEFLALFPADIVMPETQKLNAIIEKTAKFIASQGVQMEILLRAKQADNTQFQFLNKDAPLHVYYTTLINLVKVGKWPPKKEKETVEETPIEDVYLHPSLGSTFVESAPSIPSIHYKPSADCDYTMLISKIRGVAAPEEEPYETPLAPGELPPPGTEPTRLPRAAPAPPAPPAPPPARAAQITRPPMMYGRPAAAAAEKDHNSQEYYEQYSAYYQQYLTPAQPSCSAPAPPAPAPPAPAPAAPAAPAARSTGLSLMKNYNTDTESGSESETSSVDSKASAILSPPDDVQVVIDKMAAYVARNGDEFADIVRAKNDPRFTFLEPDHAFHPYYKRLMHRKRGVNDKKGQPKGDCNGDTDNKPTAPVSFCIKKLKEPDPVLPKPALPYETSSDEESENKQTDERTVQSPDSTLKVGLTQQLLPPIQIPPVILYKIEAQDKPISNTLSYKDVLVKEPTEKALDTPKPVTQEIVAHTIQNIGVNNKDVANENKPVVEKKIHKTETQDRLDYEESSTVLEKEIIQTKEFKDDIMYYRKERKKHKDRRREYESEYHSMSESRESKRLKRTPDKKSPERKKERRKDSHNHERRHKKKKEEVVNEIISIEENDDEFIDLTGELSDSKVEGDTEVEKAKQQERRRRAAEFLKKVGVDPAAASLPTSSLASALVDTLESLKKKKEDAHRRRRREKRRHRDRYEHTRDGHDGDGSHRKGKRRRRSQDERYADEGDADCEGSKKKRHRKEKKPHGARGRAEPAPGACPPPPPGLHQRPSDEAQASP